ncbi:hypothetical protein NW766_000314 [Fusarium irregulare]|uniref:Uncharacterized protein n=1 Tax=Fusarium irregulare TaxID=2494466 RepID=A0A9W8UFM1_9HYPO|nr:hypothetical protein NW766_000314 [Fusarium irregulare]
MELMGEMAHVRTQLIGIEDRYNKIKHELQASNTKPVEFSSVEKLKRNQLVINEKKKIRLETKLARLYVKVQAQLDSILKQPPSTDPSSAPAQNTAPQTDSEPRLTQLQAQIDSVLKQLPSTAPQTDLEPRLVQLQAHVENAVSQTDLESRLAQLQAQIDSVSQTDLEPRLAQLQARFENTVSQTDLEPRLAKLQAQVENTVSQTKFEPRLAQLHESLTKWTEREIEALRQFVLERREPNNAEIQALRDSLGKERQKSQALQNKIEEGQRKSQSLEERLGQLERMYQTIKPTELQISSEVNKTVTAKVSSLEEKLNQCMTSNAETSKQLQNLKNQLPTELQISSEIDKAVTAKVSGLEEKLNQCMTSTAETTEQLQSLEKQQSARPQTVVPVVPNLKAEVRHLQETVEMHKSTVEIYGRNVNFLKQQTIGDLEKAAAHSSNDIQDLRALVEKQSSTIEDQGKKQRDLKEIVSYLQKTARDLAEKHNVLDSTVDRLCSDQADEHRVLDTAVARLRSSTENCTTEQQTLSSNMTFLNSSVKDKLQALDTQASELASLQVLVKHQQEKTDDLGRKLVSISASSEEAPKLSSLQLSVKKQQKKSHELEETVASLERKISEQPLQDFKKLAGKVQEYPPATDLNRLLADYPSGKELKILITDIPRLKESISSLRARQTPPPPAPIPESLMNRETMMQTLQPSFSQLETGIKGEMNGKMTDLFERLLVFVKSEVADLESKLEDKLGNSNRQTKMVKELCDNLTTRNTEQTTKFDEAISVLGENVDKVRNESKACTDDLQYQITWLHDGLKNLSSKQWYDNVAKQIMSYIPAHFNVQLNGLTTRVIYLEDRVNDSENGNKRRRAANGSPLVMSGAR